MAHGQLPAERCREIFHKAQVGHLGTCRDGVPYAVPLTFVYFQDKIYFHSVPRGRKLENIAANPRVSFQADDEAVIIATGKACTFTTHYYSAMLEGTAKIVGDPDLSLAAMRALVAKYDPEGKAPLLRQEDFEKQDFVLVEITPRAIDGVDHARLPKR
ncbi:MAG: pyridoxamine 5'-phosphate oxidase family protein [Chloroflexi bacterium]|nr:pyridoxamine 5'-phosphate oxidase family protein [Chloroflexota bacterium]